jgi:hypothetical protein
MKKWANELNRIFSNKEVQMAKKKKKIAHDELMLIIPGCRVNANQNHVKIPPHSYWNGYHQEHKQQQMLVRIWGEKEPSYTVDEM